MSGAVILDPVTSYLGKVDSHKNAEVRAVLDPVGEMAARMRVAVIANNHLQQGVAGAQTAGLSAALRSSTKPAPPTSSSLMKTIKPEGS